MIVALCDIQKCRFSDVNILIHMLYKVNCCCGKIMRMWDLSGVLQCENTRVAGFLSLSLFLFLSLSVDLRGARHLLTSQHSLPGIPVSLKQSIDLRTSMDGKYKEIAEVRLLEPCICLLKFVR